MAKWNGIIAVGFSLLFSGCATSMKIHTDYDSSVRFANLKSYSWMTTYGGGGSAVGDRRIEELLENTVPSAVRRLLTAKGYTEVSADSADFAIGFEVALQGMRSTAINKTRGYEPSEWDQHPVDYDRGALILDIADRKTSRLIWRGSAHAKLHVTETSTKEKEERINEAVELILDRFPPRE